uniref:Citrate transport protein n=1 Tax=Timema genevievae TaxID=629358 RepID=A0A7R9PHB7_TIMGE|nr:unnamed protein product [Timema genevievae]
MSDRFYNPFQRPWMTREGAAAPNERKGLKLFKGVLAGGLAGGTEIFVTYPTEYVKTQLQLDGKSGKEKRFNGILDCTTKTVKNQGFLGLYKGVSILIYGSIPKAAVRFGCFNTIKSLVADDRGQLTSRASVMCGLIAGVCEAVLIVTPMEVIKVMFINDNRLAQPRYKSFSHGVKTIAREFGIRSFYKGLTATVIKEGSNQAMRFFVMETGKERYRKGDLSVHVPKAVVGLIGVLAGAISVLVNNPVDVVKTRMQGLESHKYKNTVDCFSKDMEAGRYRGVL